MLSTSWRGRGGEDVRVRCRIHRHECRINQSAATMVSYVVRTEHHPCSKLTLHVAGDDRLSFVLMEPDYATHAPAPDDMHRQLQLQVSCH